MTLVYILLIATIGSIIFIFLQIKKSQDSSQFSEEFFNRFGQKFPEILNQANTNLINLANEKIGTDLSNKKTAIEDMVKRVLEELSRNNQELKLAEQNRIGSFNGLKEAIENNQRLTQQLKITADSLKNVLSNNQMRGAFGEKVAEDLLKQSGFVIGTSYTKQETNGASRPDFTIYLPDKTKVNIDSKFPYANIVKWSETEDPSQKTQYLKLFEQDIKKKISDVSSRDYINPEDNTVDFVVVFIPNEMVFSFIYEKFPDLLEESFRKKIVFAGPFSFVAILRMINQAYENFKYQKNVQTIITQIKLFQTEFDKYNEEFKKIGDRIESLSRQYDEVDRARTNQLLKAADKAVSQPSQPQLPA